jgi:phage terminase large subunit-like protein
MVTISTAADSLETPLGILRRQAYAAGGVKRKGVYRYRCGAGNALHEWALDPEDDVDDMDLVKQANPAPWQTISELQGRHDSDSMRPWQWKRFACGLWVGGEDSAVSDKEWQAAAKPGLKIPPEVDEEVVVGIDLARRVDCTAVVAAAKVGDEIWVECLAIIEPPQDGTYIPEEAIWEPIEAAAERWPTGAFVADPSLGADIFLERLERQFPNIRAAPFDQKAQPLARMAGQFTEALAAGKLKHSDNPKLNAHVLAAASRPVGEGWRFVKQTKKKLPIDGVIAAGMAVSVIVSEDDEPDYKRAVWPPPVAAPASTPTPKREPSKVRLQRQRDRELRRERRIQGKGPR